MGACLVEVGAKWRKQEEGVNHSCHPSLVGPKGPDPCLHSHTP